MKSYMQNLLRQHLMDALYEDKYITVKNLLFHGTNVNLPYNHNGWTPFMYVCKEYCDTHMIELFLKYGGKVDRVNKEGQTPLHIMAQHHMSFDYLKLLIDAGANVDARDNDGWTPLMDAVKHPQAMMRKGMIYGLLELSDTSIKNNDGKTAYDIAKENKAFDDERLLLALKPVEDLTEDDWHEIFKHAAESAND